MSTYVNDGLDGVDDFTIPHDEEGVLENPFDPTYSTNNQISSTNDTTTANMNDLKPGLLNYYSQYFRSTEFLPRVRSTILNKPLNEMEDLYGFTWLVMSCALMKMITKTFFELVSVQLIQGIQMKQDSNKNIDLMFHTLWIFILFDMLGSFIISYRLSPSGTTKYVSILSVIGYSDVNWLILFPVVDFIDYLLPEGTSFIVRNGITLSLFILVLLKIIHFLGIQSLWTLDFTNKIIMAVIQILKMLIIKLIL